jgi:hypothetical protein
MRVRAAGERQRISIPFKPEMLYIKRDEQGVN